LRNQPMFAVAVKVVIDKAKMAIIFFMMFKFNNAFATAVLKRRRKRTHLSTTIYWLAEGWSFLQ
jgi:hypothetical protein